MSLAKKVKERIWFHLFIKKIIAVYFDSFVTKCIPQVVSSKIKNKSITQNMFAI